MLLKLIVPVPIEPLKSVALDGLTLTTMDSSPLSGDVKTICLSRSQCSEAAHTHFPELELKFFHRFRRV
jgi:hypothetical protein